MRLVCIEHTYSRPREKPLGYEGEENPAWSDGQVNSPQLTHVLIPPIGRYTISFSKGSPIWILSFWYIWNLTASSGVSSWGCLPKNTLDALMMQGWYTWWGGIVVEVAFTRSSLPSFLIGGRSVQTTLWMARFAIWRVFCCGGTLVVTRGENSRDFMSGGMLTWGSRETESAFGFFSRNSVILLTLRRNLEGLLWHML